jgi:hypothetical protein
MFKLQCNLLIHYLRAQSAEILPQNSVYQKSESQIIGLAVTNRRSIEINKTRIEFDKPEWKNL